MASSRFLPEPAVADVDRAGGCPGAVAVDPEAVPGVVAADAVDDPPGSAGEIQARVAVHVGVVDDLVIGAIRVHPVVDQALDVGAMLEVGPAERAGLVAGHLGPDDRRGRGWGDVAQPDRPRIPQVIGRRGWAVVPARGIDVRVGRVAVEVPGRAEVPHVPGPRGAGRWLPVPVAVAAVVDPGRGRKVRPGQQVGSGHAEQIARVDGRLVARVACFDVGTARGEPEDCNAEHATADPAEERPPIHRVGLDSAHRFDRAAAAPGCQGHGGSTSAPPVHDVQPRTRAGIRLDEPG